MITTVAVYGTLRKGFWNHSYMKNAKFLCKAKTKEMYSLYVDGLPYVIDNRKMSNITVELYEVNETGLAMLDRLEGHPSFYKRKEVLFRLEDGSLKSAWMYFYQGEDLPYHFLVSSGDYAEANKVGCTS